MAWFLIRGAWGWIKYIIAMTITFSVLEDRYGDGVGWFGVILVHHLRFIMVALEGISVSLLDIFPDLIEKAKARMMASPFQSTP